MPEITLCTYTYNDGEFVDGLMDHARGWTVIPDEVVVVDDGSPEPYEPADPLPGTRVVRLPENRGITFAKNTGLCAAKGRFIFSMDCDTRISGDWLEINLPHAKNPEIGLVGGAIRYGSGHDLVSRYLATFGDNHHLDLTGEVDFISGNAFLLRRAVWEEVDGFGGYSETNCQDHVLSARIKARGYALFSNARAQGAQIRKIPRTTMLRRVWKWCHSTVKKQFLPGERAMPYMFEALAKPMLDRLGIILGMEEPLFIYLELLYLAYQGMDVLDWAEKDGLVEKGSVQAFRSALLLGLDPFPALSSILRADLAKLDTALGREVSEPGKWKEFFMFLPTLEDSGFLAWLNKSGVPMLVREDEEEPYDFSSYAFSDLSFTK